MKFFEPTVASCVAPLQREKGSSVRNTWHLNIDNYSIGQSLDPFSLCKGATQLATVDSKNFIGMAL